MSGRTRTGLTFAALLAAAALVVAAMSFHACTRTTPAATTQSGCTFSVPTPSIASSTANFTVTATCASSKDKRQLDVALVADDPSYDDSLRVASTPVRTGTSSYSVTRKGWACHEDAKGKDEVYLRVRIEAHPGKSWHKDKWVNGSAASGDCH